MAADPDGTACDVPALLLTGLPGRPPGPATTDQPEFLAQLAGALADRVAGIPEVGHPGVYHAGPVDLGPGVECPALDPDHIDPQPGLPVALEDVLGRPPGTRKALPSGGGQGQHQPRYSLVGVEPRLQLAEVPQVGDGQAGRSRCPRRTVTVGGVLLDGSVGSGPT